MLTNPTPQRALRSPRPRRPVAQHTTGPRHHARLAARLTGRDRWLLHMLHEHRVLTSPQITALAFPSERAARKRLLALCREGVLDRFQPFVARGTAPMHYVLGPAGATALAAAAGLETKDLGYRHQRALGIAHSLRLAHTVGVNDVLASLVHLARRDLTIRTHAWWSHARCTAHFGDLVRPDAYLRLTDTGQPVEFFCEYDTGTESLTTLAAKLDGYARLAATSGLITPVLVWLPTSRRETHARKALAHATTSLDKPGSVPVATACTDLLTPEAPDLRASSPAGPIWLPLETTGPRRTLGELFHAWPHLPTPESGSTDEPGTRYAGVLPPPDPVPPTEAGR